MWPFSLTRMCAIIRKELLVLLFNRQSRLMLIVPPLMQIVLFAWGATMEVRNVHIGLLDRDGGAWSHEIVERVRGSTTFTAVHTYASEAEVAHALDTREVLAVLVFDAQFSRDIANGQPAAVQVLLDGRRSNAAQILAYYLNAILEEVSRATPMAQAHMHAGGGGVGICPRFWFNPNLEFQWFFLPTLIGILSFMLGLVVTGLSVAREREAGTFDQLMVSPATPLEIALAKLAPGCVMGLTHGTFFLLITRFGFGVPMEGSIPLLYLAMLVFSLGAGGLGLMVSSFASTQQQAFLGSFTVGVPVILLAGTVSPVDNMPQFLQYIAEINPLHHFINITLGIFLKHMSLAAVGVLLAKITAIAVCSVSIAIWMFTRRA